MEKCQTLQEVTFTLEMEKDLKKSLLAMHSLNICHIDIKPMNIMFSSHRKKAVFIDFGFSKILK
jgi:serine/threonine protein kinase